MNIPKRYKGGKVLPILKLGQPILNNTCMPVSKKEIGIKNRNDYLRRIALELLATSYHHDGAGLSALQVGVDLSMFVITVHPTKRYPDVPIVPDMVVVNPEIISVSNEQTTVVEGCLSILGFYTAVTRPESIAARYILFDYKTGKFERVTKKHSGFVARVFQHEYDHTNGILFPSRVQNWKFCAVEENRNLLRERTKQRCNLGDFPFTLL